MKKTSFVRLILCFILISSLLLPVQASSTDNIKSNMRSTNERLNQLTNSRKNLKTYMGNLDSQLSELSGIMNNLDEQKAEKEEEIVRTQAELEEAKEQETEQYSAMKKRIKYIYESGNLDIISVFLASENMSDLLNKIDYVNQISEYDRKMLTAYEETKELVAAKEETLLTEQEELTALQKQTAEQQASVSAMLTQASRELSQFDTDISSAQNQLSEYENELQKKEDELRAKQEEEAKKEQTKKEQASANTTEKNTNNSTVSDKGNNDSNGDGNNSNNNSDNNNNNNSGGGGNGSYSDLEMLAALIQCEAGGESAEGKVAVGSVVMNRVGSSRYPGSVLGVIYQSGQFAPVTSGRFALVLAKGANSSCVAAAQQAMGGAKPVGGCLYFRTIASAQNAGIEPVYTIGNHVFY